ncbi:hypothetical protein [Dactylosporangium sp. NPDC048998]|uniref:hypothetical protein n=1 Tax=Dactylosporangium sp. NPDC048998 TaxID=3363976 RepID=UPI003718E5DA
MRADLLALTPDALAALTNRGLVKRATREVEAAPPSVTLDADGTLRGAYADGPAPALPTGGLDRATCTCGAIGACRHVIGLVLAYQRLAATTAGLAATTAGLVATTGLVEVSAGFVEATTEHCAAATGEGSGGASADRSAGAVVDWSPGDFTDEQLAARIGARMLAAARRAWRTGYHARVRRATATDPAPRVDLGSAAVRFLVPHDLGFVHTDAVAGVRDDVIALAVWAFRVADAQAPGDLDVRVDVAGEAPARPGPAAGQRDASLGAALRLADEVLLGGAVHAGGGLGAAVADVRRRLDRDNLRWPLLAVGELAEQLEAYRDRGSAYVPERLAALVGELHARARAVRGPDVTAPARKLGTDETAETPARTPGTREEAEGHARASGTAEVAEAGMRPRAGGGLGGGLGGGARARVLGTEEAAEAPMRRARLDGLGCRVVAAGGEATGDERRVVELYFAHADTATVLVLRRDWAGAEGGAELGRRRIGGASVAQLAGGSVVTESAVRSASRAVRLATGRIAKTTVTPSRGAWAGLPAGVLVRDLRSLAEELDRLPPRVVRPRVEAELVRVVEIAEVRLVAYSPGDQRLDAVVADAAGGVATVTAIHTVAAPGRLDAIAAAMHAGPGFVSGVVRRTGGGIVIEPLGVVVGDTVVVPDLAAAVGGGLGTRWDGDGDPLRAAVDRAVRVLADVPHRGLRHLPPSFGDRLRDTRDELLRAGLHRAGAAVGAFRDALGPDPGEVAVAAWVDAHLRLTITAELF